MDEFFLPGEPEELWNSDSDLAFRCENFTDLAESSPEEIGEIAENLAFVLCDQDPLCIVEQQNFDQLCSLVASFGRVEGPKRRQLIDSLCSSLTCLNAWIDKLLSAPADTIDSNSVRQHRSAFKAYIFFLAWISGLAVRESHEAAAESNASSASQAMPGGGRGRKKKAAATAVAGWDWSAQFPKAVKAVAQALNTDLWALFRPSGPEEALLIKAMQLATRAFEDPGCTKCEEQAVNAAHIMAMAALKYQQLDNATAAIVDVLTKYDHTPVLVAGTLRYTIQQWDDGRLAAAVLGEIAAVDPAEYERQQSATGEKAGVRSVAAFVKEMANQLPKLMATQISLLLPHLGGKAYSLRSAIMHAISSLLHNVYGSDAMKQATADAQGAQARLLQKQHLLDLLCERIRDQSSYTRVAVLQAWEYLAEHKAIPLGHWQTVTDMAVGRLEDKSSLVRKEALRLLQALMLYNPFGHQLIVGRFETTLALHRQILDQLEPPEEAQKALLGQQGDDLQQAIEVEGGEAAEEGGQEGGADVPVKAEPGAEVSIEEMEVDGEVAAAGGEEEQKEAAAEGDQEAADEQPAQRVRSPAEFGFDGTIEDLRMAVASLTVGITFCKALTACLPTITQQLLSSSTISDVQESIAMLLTCKQFELDGAADAIRKMLPLIFATDQAVKDRIVEALDQLYINGWSGNIFSSAQAARNLIDLATGATLGELGSLEEVVKEFVQKQFLRPIILAELWGIAAEAFRAMEQRAAGANRAHRDLRAALAILSMSAATQPENFTQKQVEDLLRFGFSQAVSDALITRHACITLQRLAVNCKAGKYNGIMPQIYAALTSVVVASSLPEAAWCSAAESAVSAIYILHPAPEHLSAAILKHLARQAFTSAEGDSLGAAADAMEADDPAEGTAVEGNASQHGAARWEEGGEARPAASQQASGATQQARSIHNVAPLSRFLFVLGHVALQHLVFVERAAKGVRRMRMEREKRAAEERAERLAAGRTPGGGEEEDINAELGVGSVAADAELDAMKEQAEAQILAARSLLGPYACLVSAMCFNISWLLGADTRLRGAALLALTKLMVVDASFCEHRPTGPGGHSNLDLLFTLVQREGLEARLRSNLIIALGDLALRFPNVLEPYTEFMYRPLLDSDASVRKNTLMVLTHLILNDMMKVKGHIAKMALCLEDSEDRIAALAQLFFHELAKKEYKGTSPIYNLLPDILSNLSKEPNLTKPQFQSIMQHLLGYIKKDKQGDSLIEKLCQRFAATEDVAQWHSIAFCLTQLPLSEKGLKKLSESFRFYKHTLGDEEVAAAITSIIQKAKKGSNKQDLKAEIEAFEQKIAEYAQERADEERTAEEARRHAEERAAAAAADSGLQSGEGGPADAGDVSEMRRQLGDMQLEEESGGGGPAAGADAEGGTDAEAEAMSEDDRTSEQAQADAAAQEGGTAAAGGPQPAVSEQQSGTAVKVKPDPDARAAEHRADQEAEQLPRKARGRRSAAAAVPAKPAVGRHGSRRRTAVVEEEEEEENEDDAAAEDEDEEQQEEEQEQEAAAANRQRAGSRGSGCLRGGKVASLASVFSGQAADAEDAAAPSASAKGGRRSGRRSAQAEADSRIPAVRVKEEPMS